MPPFAKIIRTMLFLPIREEEDRQERLRKTMANVKSQREKSEAAVNRLEKAAENLRETYDELLGKME